MSASDRFAAWVKSKITRRVTRKPPQEPSDSPVPPQETQPPQEPPEQPQGAYSVYECGNIIHIAFNHRRWSMSEKQDESEQVTRRIKRDKDYIDKKDPITRRISRVPKKDVGGISKVLYYDEKGHLIE